MKIKNIVTVLLVAILLVSCVPVPVTDAVPVTATIIVAMDTATPTLTPMPLAAVQGRAILSDYPGINFCAAQTVIPEDAQVAVTGTFNDFVAVEFQKKRWASKRIPSQVCAESSSCRST